MWLCDVVTKGGTEYERFDAEDLKSALMDDDLCMYAAQNGHLHTLQWLRARDPPCLWHEWTCEGAAANGHLEVLKWLRSQELPCPWGEITCRGAAANGHLEVLQWLRSQEPPVPVESKSLPGNRC